MRLVKEFSINTYFNLLATFTLLITGMLFTACKDDDASVTPDIPDTPADDTSEYWYLEEKGYVLKIDGESNQLYTSSSAGCLVFDPDFDLSGYSMNRVSDDKLLLTDETAITDLILTKLDDFSDICLEGVAESTDDPKTNFDYFWNIFNDYYAFFELKGVDWDEMKSLRASVTKDNYMEVFSQMVLPLNDRHVSVTSENGEIDSGKDSLLERLNGSLDESQKVDDYDDLIDLLISKIGIINSNYIEEALGGTDDFYAGMLNENTAYINILSMYGYGGGGLSELEGLNQLLDETMEQLKDNNTEKVIIDMRFNSGGTDAVSLDIASRFLDHERIVFSKKAILKDGSYTPINNITITPKGTYQFTGDIIVLISPLTVSAAEIFVLAMKNLPYVTLVGENTGAAFSDILDHILPNGTLVGLSNEIYADPTGIVYEHVGIGPLPKNSVPFLSTEDFESNIDSGIDHALSILNK